MRNNFGTGKIIASSMVLGLFLSLAGIAVATENQSPDPQNEGVALYLSGDSGAARAYFESRLADADAKNEALLYLSRLALDKGDPDAAVDYVAEALDEQPNGAEELKLSGDVYCNKAQESSMFSALRLARKCIGQYRAALDEDPEHIPALVAAASFSLTAPSVAGGSSKRGAELLERLSELSPEDADVVRIQQLKEDGNPDKALKLADALSTEGFHSSKNQYEVALFYKDREAYDKAKPLFEQLLTSPVTVDSKWHITDAHLQLGEILLAKGADLEKSIELIETYKEKNNNPSDAHYFWSTWSLAKAYKASGDAQKYRELVQTIQSQDYEEDEYFAKEFEHALKE